MMVQILLPTVCPRSSDPIYIVTYYISWVTTSWTYSMRNELPMTTALLVVLDSVISRAVNLLLSDNCIYL